MVSLTHLYNYPKDKAYRKEETYKNYHKIQLFYEVHLE